MRRLLRLYQPYICSLILLLLMIGGRMIGHRSLHFAFLLWNIFLAVLPLLFAHLAQRRQHSLLTVLYSGTWLLFFPNAAYLITDIVHLRAIPGNAYWLDLVILSGSGMFGVAVGLRSLHVMEGGWRQWMDSAAARRLSYAVLLSSGYGIYLGRVERWNSWDLVCDPVSLLRSVAYEVRHPFRCIEVWELSAVFAAALVLAYTISGRRLRFSYFVEGLL